MIIGREYGLLQICLWRGEEHNTPSHPCLLPVFNVDVYEVAMIAKYGSPKFVPLLVFSQRYCVKAGDRCVDIFVGFGSACWNSSCKIIEIIMQFWTCQGWDKVVKQHAKKCLKVVYPSTIASVVFQTHPLVGSYRQLFPYQLFFTRIGV